MGFDIGFELKDLNNTDLENLLTVLEQIDTHPDPDGPPLFRLIMDRTRSVRKIKEEMGRRVGT